MGNNIGYDFGVKIICNRDDGELGMSFVADTAYAEHLGGASTGSMEDACKAIDFIYWLAAEKAKKRIMSGAALKVSLRRFQAKDRDSSSW